MRAAARPAAERPLRAAAWGQILLRDPGLGEPPLLVEQVRVTELTMEAALAVADRRRRLQHPSVVPVTRVEAGADLGLDRAIRVELLAPRGAALAAVMPRAGRLGELGLATLFRDALRGVQHAHGHGVAVGVFGPDHLVLCPPGQEDLPPLLLVHAGLPALVAAARGQADAAEHPGFESLHPQAEVVAPEVLAGAETSAASDVYAICATLAWCVLGRHLHAAPQPAAVRSQAQHGPSSADAAELLQWLPRLGPALLRGLEAQQWARSGVLAELIALCEELTQSVPTVELDGRAMCAPWARGSPLVPLAAYGSAGWWADRWLSRSGAGAAATGPLRQVTGQLSAPALSAADSAKLRIALERLDSERVRTQQESVSRRAQVWRGVGLAVALVLALGAVLAVGIRQVREVGRQERQRLELPGASGQRRVPPRPQPRMLTPQEGLGY